MTIGQVLEYLARTVPAEAAEEWDNCGLQIGDPDRQCRSVLTCLDATPSVVAQAVAQGCELIVSHHPVLFGSVRSLPVGEYTADVLAAATRGNVAIASAHTNLDACADGINEQWMRLLDCKIESGAGACYRIGVASARKLCDLAKRVANICGERPRRIGDRDRLCSRICVASGSGGRDEAWIEVLRAQAVDVFVSAEIKHSVARRLDYYGIAALETTHYASERIAADILARRLADTGLTVRVADAEQSPYQD